MSLDIPGVTDALASHALTLGYFSRVNMHEAKARIGAGLLAAVWFHEIAPSRSGSGLASTSAVLIMRFRIYGSMLQEPQDQIDPDMLTAASAYIGALSGAFTLGGLVRNVDLLGAQGGRGLAGRSGYINLSGQLCRVIDVDVPLVVNDVWEQVG